MAVEDASGEVEAIQLKSASKTNPISNRSVDLWKTIGNWIRAVENKELRVERTIFHLRLGRKRSGAICESFAKASTPLGAGAAVEKAKSEFFTTKGKLKKGVPADLREAVEAVFSPLRSATPAQHRSALPIVLRDHVCIRGIGRPSQNKVHRRRRCGRCALVCTWVGEEGN